MSIVDRILGRLKIFTGARTGDAAMTRQGELDLAMDEAERSGRQERAADLRRERSGGALAEARTRSELEAQAAALGVPAARDMTKRELAEAIEEQS